MSRGTGSNKVAFPVGSVVSVRYSSKAGSFLALVVDQEMGQMWMDKDPVCEYLPDDPRKERFTIVRVLGDKYAELSPPRSSLREEEPNKTEFVRFLYAQNDQAHVFCYPGAATLQKCLKNFTNMAELGVLKSDFFPVIRDLEVLVAYRYGEVPEDVEKTKSEYCRYYKMLRELLPDLEGKVSG